MTSWRKLFTESARFADISLHLTDQPVRGLCTTTTAFQAAFCCEGQQTLGPRSPGRWGLARPDAVRELRWRWRSACLGRTSALAMISAPWPCPFRRRARELCQHPAESDGANLHAVPAASVLTSLKSQSRARGQELGAGHRHLMKLFSCVFHAQASPNTPPGTPSKWLSHWG